MTKSMARWLLVVAILTTAAILLDWVATSLFLHSFFKASLLNPSISARPHVVASGMDGGDGSPPYTITIIQGLLRLSYLLHIRRAARAFGWLVVFMVLKTVAQGGASPRGFYCLDHACLSMASPVEWCSLWWHGTALILCCVDCLVGVVFRRLQQVVLDWKWLRGVLVGDFTVLWRAIIVCFGTNLVLQFGFGETKIMDIGFVHQRSLEIDFGVSAINSNLWVSGLSSSMKNGSRILLTGIEVKRSTKCSVGVSVKRFESFILDCLPKDAEDSPKNLGITKRQAEDMEAISRIKKRSTDDMEATLTDEGTGFNPFPNSE